MLVSCGVGLLCGNAYTPNRVRRRYERISQTRGRKGNQMETETKRILRVTAGVRFR